MRPAILILGRCGAEFSFWIEEYELIDGGAWVATVMIMSVRMIERFLSGYRRPSWSNLVHQRQQQAAPSENERPEKQGMSLRSSF